MVRRTPPMPVSNFVAFVLVVLSSAPPSHTYGRDAVSGSALPELQEAPPSPPAGYPTQQAIIDAAIAGKVPIANLLAPVPSTVEVNNDVVYREIDQIQLRADIYRRKMLNEPRPLLVFIHGGAWKSGNENAYKIYCQRFADRGYVCASISYRLSDQAPYPAAKDDVRAAIAWLREHAAEYHIDPSKIALIGGSAGAHLAMLEAFTSDAANKVQAVVDLYGPCDLTTGFARDNDVVVKFLQKRYTDAQQLYQEASPLFHLSPDDPPTLILHGTVDETVPIDQSDALADRLEELKIPYVYDRLPGWAHTMDLGKPVQERCLWFMDRFFARYVPLPDQP